MMMMIKHYINRSVFFFFLLSFLLFCCNDDVTFYLLSFGALDLSIFSNKFLSSLGFEPRVVPIKCACEAHSATQPKPTFVLN